MTVWLALGIALFDLAAVIVFVCVTVLLVRELKKQFGPLAAMFKAPPQ